MKSILKLQLIMVLLFFTSVSSLSANREGLKDGVYLGEYIIAKNLDGETIVWLEDDERHLRVSIEMPGIESQLTKLIKKPSSLKGFTKSSEHIIYLIYKRKKSTLSIAIGNRNYEIVIKELLAQDNKTKWAFSKKNPIKVTTSKLFVESLLKKLKASGVDKLRPFKRRVRYFESVYKINP